MMVSNGTLRCVSIGCLRSGHSHEDVDQIFGSLAMFVLRKCKVAASPLDFRQCLQDFLEQLPRPYEPLRWTVKLDAIRDWPLA